MISTTPYLDGWLLVASETTVRAASTGRTGQRRVDTSISLHWTGDGWSNDIDEAEYFQRQDDAIQFMRANREKMESLL